MLKKASKKIFLKGMDWVVRALPVIIPALLSLRKKVCKYEAFCGRI